MGRGGPKRIGAFLTGGLSRALADYLDETTRLRAVWQAHVPEPLASHALPVRIAGGALVVHADTPVWASRLRQQQRTLVSRLAREPFLRNLKDIRIKVVPPAGTDANPVPSAPAHRLPLSSATGRLLQSVAAGIENPTLRASLLRLAELSSAASSRGR